MKKLVITGLMAVFVMACTVPEAGNNEYEEFGTKKSESVSSESDGSEFELDNSED